MSCLLLNFKFYVVNPKIWQAESAILYRHLIRVLSRKVRYIQIDIKLGLFIVNYVCFVLFLEKKNQNS